MQSTLELINRAEATGRSLRDVSQAIGLDPNGLARERNRGKLSPAIAAALAIELGEDAGRCAILAATESSKTPPTLARRLAAELGDWRKR